MVIYGNWGIYSMQLQAAKQSSLQFVLLLRGAEWGGGGGPKFGI